MEEFVHALGSYGVAPFSALLTASLLYWLMVILGAMDLDILHFGHGHDAGHHGGDHAEAHAPGGLFHGLLEFLSIGKVPITITLSILIVIGWGVAMALTLLLHLWWPLVLATALLVGIPLTGFATRPLRALFTALSGGVATGVSLIGREARITSATGSVPTQLTSATGFAPARRQLTAKFKEMPPTVSTPRSRWRSMVHSPTATIFTQASLAVVNILNLSTGVP